MNRITLASLFAATLFAVSLASDPSMARTGAAGPSGGAAAAGAASGGSGETGESRTVRRAACVANCGPVIRPRPRPVRVRARQVQTSPECWAFRRIQHDVAATFGPTCDEVPN